MLAFATGPVLANPPAPCREFVARMVGASFARLQQLLPYQGTSGRVPRPTVGIEIEGEIPDSMDFKDVAEIIKGVVGRRYPEGRVTVEHDARWRMYSVKFWDGEHENTIRIHTEDFKANSGHRPIEISSNILRSSAHRETFDDVVQAMKASGMRALPRKAGFHVHLGKMDMTHAEIWMLVKTFSKLDRRLMLSWATASERSRYTQATAAVHWFLEHLRIERVIDRDLRQYLDDVGFEYLDDNSRQVALNLVSLLSIGTFEFRFPNSTVETADINATVDFLSELVVAVRELRPELLEFLGSQDETKLLDLEELFRALKLDPERATALQKSVRKTLAESK